MLTGDRVVLRPGRPEDREPMWRARQDPLTWARTTEAPLLPETLEAYVVRLTERRGGPDAAEFGVDDAGGTFLGRASLFHVDALTRHAEVGITLLPSARSQGFGRDALQVLVDYAFRSRNLRRVHLQTLASNPAALRCYAAVGFVEEGRLREHAWVEGTYDDIVLMGLLRDQTSSPNR